MLNEVSVDKIYGFYMIMFSILCLEYFDIFEKGIVEKIDFLYVGV